MPLDLDRQKDSFISMNEFEANLEFPEHQTLFRNWQGMCTGNEPPYEATFSIEMVGELSPWITLIKVEASERGYRYRAEHAGAGVTERFGRDITGKYADELYSQSYLQQLGLSYGHAVETGSPNLWRCILETPEGETLYYDRLILPLLNDQNRVGALISAFAFHAGWGTSFAPAPPGQSTWLKLA